jgi:hypothetical protein
MAGNNNNPPPASKEGPGGSRAESDHDLVAHLEQLTGRRIKSRQDIRDYVSDLSVTAENRRSKRQRLKIFLLAALLLVAAGQYYFLDIQLQILSQPSLVVFVPVKGDSAPRRPYI